MFKRDEMDELMYALMMSLLMEAIESDEEKEEMGFGTTEESITFEELLEMLEENDGTELLYMEHDDVKELFEIEDKSKEMVNHPSHYNHTFLETMEKFLLFCMDKPDYIKGAMLFNVMKYTDRAGHKNTSKEGKEEDEAKAKFYLDVMTDLFPDEVVYYNKYRKNKKNK